MKKHSQKTYRMVLYALFAALTIVLTLLIRIPIPFAQGYFNIGDSIILLASLLLGPGAGIWVGSIGSALADFLGGYAVYAPFTFFVKGAEGFVAGVLFRKTQHAILSTAFAGIIMTLGYFVTDWFLFSLSAAIAALPLNLLQGFVGAGLSVLLYQLLHSRFRMFSK